MTGTAIVARLLGKDVYIITFLQGMLTATSFLKKFD